MPIPLLVADGQGRIVFGNGAFERLTGVIWESLRGVLVTELGQLRTVGTQFSSREPWQGEAIWTTTEGKEIALYLDLHSISFTDECRGYCLLFFAAESDTARNRRKERLESLGRLAGGIAHDLNNLLTGILGHVSYLHWALAETGAHADSIKAIEDGARRGASLLNQILEFAKGEQAEYRSVNLSLLVNAAFNLFRAALPSNITTEIKSESPELFVHGDEGQLSQLVMNLAVNARDALPNGGRIEISLTRVMIDNPQNFAVDSGSALGSGAYIKLVIQDDGTGIPKDLRDRIFEPFFTTKAQKGTGLGLANVAAIVQAHNGLITVESEEGKGTLFEVYLPEAAAKTDERSDAEQTSLPTGKERILVVEDEETVRVVIQRCLEHLGYEVEVAEDGTAALDMYAKTPSHYSLVILDMMMPKMSGDEVFEQLKAINPKVRVLISSGYSTDGRAQSILDNGGLGFIPKPFAIEDLAREVRRCLDL